MSIAPIGTIFVVWDTTFFLFLLCWLCLCNYDDGDGDGDGDEDTNVNQSLRRGTNINIEKGGGYKDRGSCLEMITLIVV